MPNSDNLTVIQLLNKLRLAEDDKIKRAAIILFGIDPGKFYPNITVKIGRFKKNVADLIFQEVIQGNLIFLLKEVISQLNNKFLIKPIVFEGLKRIEKGQYPTSAIREALLNALVHRSYMGAPIQIRVFDDRISFWNEGSLPYGLSAEKLKLEHNSRPRNPLIADACFKAGYIDAWERGTIAIYNACKEAELPEPQITEIDGGLQVTLFNKLKSSYIYTTEHDTEHDTEQVTEQVVKLISFMEDKEYTTYELMVKVGIIHRPTFLYNYIQPSIKLKVIQFTIPDKPKSKNQKYKLTPLGKMLKNKYSNL